MTTAQTLNKLLLCANVIVSACLMICETDWASNWNGAGQIHGRKGQQGLSWGNLRLSEVRMLEPALYPWLIYWSYCLGQESFSSAFSHSLFDIFVGSDLENLRSRYFARCFHIVESTLRISPCQKEFKRGSIQLQSRLYHFTVFHHCVRYYLLYMRAPGNASGFYSCQG